MKKKLIKPVILFACFVFVFQSCQKDSTIDPTLSTVDRDKFLGSWITTSTGSVHGTLSFTMNITAGTSSAAQIKIENFDAEGFGTYVLADVSGSSASVTQQIVNGDTIQGSGTYNNNGTLSFTYSFRDGQTEDHRTASAHK